MAQPKAFGNVGDSAVRGSVLISGASTGIGYACAMRLAQAGFQVWAGYRNPADAERLESVHPGIAPLRLDVTCQNSIDEAMETFQSALAGQGLAALVNNAGIAVGGPVEFTPVEAWRRQLEVNVLGVVALTQACIPLLRRARGRIVNMGSVAGFSALPFVAPYSASKYALESLTDALRVELRPWGIQTAIIEPGVIDTPIWEKSMQAAIGLEPQPSSRLTELYGRVLDILRHETQQAAKRGISPDYVAKAVLHAVAARHPKTRYRVGRDAQLRKLFTVLPDRWKDWLIVKKLGFPG